MSENNRMNKEAASKALRVIKNDLSVVSHTPIDRVKLIVFLFLEVLYRKLLGHIH